MAKEHRPDKAISELRQEISDSRARLARDLTGLRFELDFPRKLRRSFQSHAGIWISAAILTGVVLTARAMPRKKIVYATRVKADRKNEPTKNLLSAGLLLGGLRFVAVVLRPVAIRFVTRKLRDYASGASRRRKW